MLLMGLQCHSDLLCEFILQQLYMKFGVIFKFVSYVFAIKMYHLTYQKDPSKWDQMNHE